MNMNNNQPSVVLALPLASGGNPFVPHVEHALIGLRGESIPREYRDLIQYLNKKLPNNIRVSFEENFDYSKSNLASKGSKYFAAAQCRVERLNDKVAAIAEELISGAVINLPIVAIGVGDGKFVLSYGNTRHAAGVKAKISGPIIFIDEDNQLNDENSKITLISDLSQLSNKETTEEKTTDSKEDLEGQLSVAWSNIMSADLEGNCPIQADNRKILEEYNALEDEEGKLTYKRNWADKWLDNKSPYKYREPNWRTQIFNAAFEQGTSFNIIKEFKPEELTEQFKLMFDTSFHYLTGPKGEHSPYVNMPKCNKLQVVTTIGSINGAVGNCVLNLTSAVMRQSFNFGVTPGEWKEADIIIKGHGSTRSPTLNTRENHVKSILKDFKNWNTLNNEDNNRSKGCPTIMRVFFPQVLRSVEEGPGDRPRGYFWNTATLKFEEVNAPPTEKKKKKGSDWDSLTPELKEELSKISWE